MSLGKGLKTLQWTNLVWFQPLVFRMFSRPLFKTYWIWMPKFVSMKFVLLLFEVTYSHEVSLSLGHVVLACHNWGGNLQIVEVCQSAWPRRFEKIDPKSQISEQAIWMWFWFLRTLILMLPSCTGPFNCPTSAQYTKWIHQNGSSFAVDCAPFFWKVLRKRVRSCQTNHGCLLGDAPVVLCLAPWCHKQSVLD